MKIAVCDAGEKTSMDDMLGGSRKTAPKEGKQAATAA